ncbi:MAG: hypothetical protein V8Q54_05525 [Alistipes senegalensis]
MNERQKRIERLAERWFAAQATDAEERELREWMRRAADVPEWLREVRTLSADWTRSPGSVPRNAGSPAGYGAWRRFGELPRRRAVALGFASAPTYCASPTCYIDGVAVYDAEVAMQTTVYLESFSALEESGRMVDELIENN